MFTPPATPAAPARRRRVRQLGLLLAALAVWEALPDSGLVSRIILASPASVVRAAANSGTVFVSALAITLAEIAVAFVAAAVVGITLGTICGSIPFLRKAVVPMLESAFAVPWVIVYPLLVAWFGIGVQSKVLFGFLHGLFPILLNTTAAIASLDTGYLLLCRSLGASKRDTLFKVLVRAALPGVLAGLRVGLALSVITVLIAEILASTTGLGYLISTNQNLFNTGEVYLGVALAVLVAWLANRLINAVEVRLSTLPSRGATG
jgi:NitT/TauT family transport system permease protein